MSKSKYEDFEEMGRMDRNLLNEEMFYSASKEQIVNLALNKTDLILYGPPGTGKTYHFDKIIESIKEKGKLGVVETIQFHSSYSYEDFIEGIAPNINTNGFKYKDGQFKTLIKKIKSFEDEKEKVIHILFIDEMNRADITSVFGELLNLMEDKGTRKIRTAKQQQELFFPKNLVIIGALNTSDRALAKMDLALRRRFRFIPLFPNKQILRELISIKGFDSTISFSIDDYLNFFEKINFRIAHSQMYGKDLALGHILFVPKTKNEKFCLTDIADNFRNMILTQIESFAKSDIDFLKGTLGVPISEKIMYGKFVSDKDISELISKLRTDRTGEIE